MESLYAIKNKDITKGNISLVSAFENTLKGSLIFWKTCNPKGESYYIQGKFKETGEEAVYSQYYIKDVILAKFICFIFGDNNQGYISGINKIPLIHPEIIIKQKKYKLVEEICSPSVIHFTAFIYNCREDYFGLNKGDNYYYDGLNNNGAIIKIDDLFNYLLDKNPYLLIYYNDVWY